MACGGWCGKFKRWVEVPWTVHLPLFFEPDDKSKPREQVGGDPLGAAPAQMTDAIRPRIEEAIKKAKNFDASGEKKCLRQDNTEDPDCVCTQPVNSDHSEPDFSKVPIRRWITTRDYTVHSAQYKGTFSFTLTFEFYWQGPTGRCEDKPDF